MNGAVGNNGIIGIKLAFYKYKSSKNTIYLEITQFESLILCQLNRPSERTTFCNGNPLCAIESVGADSISARILGTIAIPAGRYGIRPYWFAAVFCPGEYSSLSSAHQEPNFARSSLYKKAPDIHLNTGCLILFFKFFSQCIVHDLLRSLLAGP